MVGSLRFWYRSAPGRGLGRSPFDLRGCPHAGVINQALTSEGESFFTQVVPSRRAALEAGVLGLGL